MLPGHAEFRRAGMFEVSLIRFLLSIQLNTQANQPRILKTLPRPVLGFPKKLFNFWKIKYRTSAVSSQRAALSVRMQKLKQNLFLSPLPRDIHRTVWAQGLIPTEPCWTQQKQVLTTAVSHWLLKASSFLLSRYQILWQDYLPAPLWPLQPQTARSFKGASSETTTDRQEKRGRRSDPPRITQETPEMKKSLDSHAQAEPQDHPFSHCGWFYKHSEHVTEINIKHHRYKNFLSFC